jgi:hypothetical protein
VDGPKKKVKVKDKGKDKVEEIKSMVEPAITACKR